MAPFNPELHTIVECDSSRRAIGAVMLQENNKGILRIVAYLLRKLLAYKANYLIHDKELLVVIYYLRE